MPVGANITNLGNQNLSDGPDEQVREIVHPIPGTVFGERSCQGASSQIVSSGLGIGPDVVHDMIAEDVLVQVL